MIFLIGGASRVGKSIIGTHLTNIQKIPLITTDDLCLTSRSSTYAVSEEIVSVPPFSGNPLENTLSVTERVRLQKEEGRLLESEIWSQLQKTIDQRASLIVEGIHLLPEFLKRIQDQYSSEHIGIILIGSTDLQTVIQGIHADTSEDNWLQESPEDVIRQVADFTVSFSQALIEDTNRYSLRYLERTADFNHDIHLVETLFRSFMRP